MAMAMQATEITHQSPRRAIAMAVLALLTGATTTALGQTAVVPTVTLPGIGQTSARPLSSESALSYGVRGGLLHSNNLDLLTNRQTTGHWLLEAAPYVTYNDLTPRGPVSASASIRAQFRDGEAAAFRARGAFEGNTDLKLSEDWLHLSARGSVQTVNVDPFRASSSDPGTQGLNTASRQDFEVSPYVKGKLDGDGTWRAAYRVRYIELGNVATVSSLYSGTNVQQGLEGNFRTDLSNRSVAVSVDARYAAADYRNGLNYEGGEIDLLAWLRVSSTLRVAGGIGWSYNDRLTVAGDDSGAGAVASVEWTPTPRTSVKARWADRYYGKQISANADHRFGPWTFGLAYRKGLQDGNTANLYELLWQLGINPTSPGSLASPLMYVDQLSASVKAQGARTSLQASVFFNDRSAAIIQGGAVPGDLNQRGATLVGSYRIDGAQTANLGLRYTLTDSVAIASEARLWSLIGSWDRRMTPKWTLSVGARLQKQTGTGVTVEYDEAALFLATDYRFQ